MAANPFATHHTNSVSRAGGTEIEAVCNGREWQSSRSAKANMRRVVRLIKPISGSSRYRERERSLIQPWRRLAARGHLLSAAFWQVLAKTFSISPKVQIPSRRFISSRPFERIPRDDVSETFENILPPRPADDRCCTRDAHFTNK